MSKTKEKQAVSNFNLQKLNTEELIDHLKASIQSNSNVFVFGRRGTGKTEICTNTIQGMTYIDSSKQPQNYDALYLNLSLYERVDIGGYPDIMGSRERDERKRKFIEYILPAFFRKLVEGNKKVVALLDEVDKADPSILAPLLEFVNDHRIGGEPLPNLSGVIMTGNLVAEGGVKPSPPLLDRAEKYLVEADPKMWLDWAGKVGGVHPSIISFISDNDESLLGNIDLEDNYADESPRGWKRASDLIKAGEEAGWSSNLIYQKVAGRVGVAAALKFQAYFDHYRELLPQINEFFENKNAKNLSVYANKLEQTKKLVLCFMVANRFGNILNQTKGAPEEAQMVAEFFKNVSPELALITVRTQIGLEKLIANGLLRMDAWKELAASLKTDDSGSNK